MAPRLRRLCVALSLPPLLATGFSEWPQSLAAPSLRPVKRVGRQRIAESRPSRFPRQRRQGRPETSTTAASASKVPRVDLVFDEDGEGSVFEALEKEDAKKSAEASELLQDEEKLGKESSESVADLAEQLQADARKRHVMHKQALELCNAVGLKSVFLLGAMDNLFPPSRILSNGLVEGVYVDATFGRGGLTRELLARLTPESRVYAFDIDPDAVKTARELAQEDDRLIVFQRSFADIDEVIKEKVDGVLIDPGIANPFDPEARSRGLSMSNLRRGDKRPLDLRFNREAGVPASEWLRTASTEELAWVLSTHAAGIPPLLADRIAQVVHDEQALSGPFKTLERFAEVVGKAVATDADSGDRKTPVEHPRRATSHPARSAVAALRHFLNQENEQLRLALSSACSVLRYGGRCLVLAYKPSEELNIEDFLMWHQEPQKKDAKRLSSDRLCELWPLMGTGLDFKVETVPGFPMVRQPTRLEQRATKPALNRVKLYVMEKKRRILRRLKANPRPLKSRFAQPPATPPLL